MSKQTYASYNRISGYFNNKYSTLIKAYAHAKSMSVSDLMISLGTKFINEIPEPDQNKIREDYLRDRRTQDI